MMTSCVLAVSGTPGTGKTTLCEAMEGEGWQVLSLATLAEEHDCMGPVDEADGAAPIDVHRLAETGRRPWKGVGLSTATWPIFWRLTVLSFSGANRPC